MFGSQPTASQNTDEIEVSQEKRLKSFISIVGAVFATAFLSSLILAIIQNQWTLFVISGLFAITTITCVLSLSSVWNTSETIKLLSIEFTTEVALVFVSAIYSSFASGIPIAIIAILLAFLFTSYNRSGWLNDIFIGIGMIGALAGLTLQTLAPFPQINGTIYDYLIGIATALVIVIFIRLLIIGMINFNIRIKLTMAALTISLVPLLILATINSRTIQNSIQTQSNETLKYATQLVINDLDSYFANTINSLNSEASLPAIISYMALPSNARAGSIEEANLISTLNSLQTQESTYALGYGLINTYGVNVYDTNSSKMGKSVINTDYFKQASATGSSYISSVEFESNSRQAYIYFISPVYDSNQILLGFLRMTVDARVLQTMLLEKIGVIGTHTYPILLDENGLRLGDASNPNLLYHMIRPIDSTTYKQLYDAGRLPTYIDEESITSEIPEINRNVLNNESAPLTFFSVDMQKSLTGILDTATYAPMTKQKWTVVYLQEQTAVINAQKSLARTTTLLAILISALVSIFATIVSNIFTRPILNLTDSAVKIAAGDLSTPTRITSRDEIGILGNAFNSMTEQLRESIQTLESRVRDRTEQLAMQNETLLYRSRQLQTVADVARGIVTTTDFESLLNSITTLISDRFNYYHVGIFLIDEKGEYAILRASNSVGGQAMLARQHKLKVGQVGIVGYVTGSGQPRIATDVGKDAVFFNNPDLPDTKSEMALPLKIENRIIGALDIQSTESNAFTEDDISLFTTLADQVSAAINTNQLLANTEMALAEAQNLHRQYLDQEWTKRSYETETTNYKFTSQGLVKTDENLPEIRMVFDSNRPVTRSYVPDEPDAQPYSVLAIPILLRGQAIGVIHLRQTGDQDFAWSENELVIVQNVADQVAQTLESARLFEQTIRRADRERRVLEITNKIRSTNEPQKMLEVTLEELKKHLGASQTQIVINVPGITSSLSNSNPPINPSHPSAEDERQNQ